MRASVEAVRAGRPALLLLALLLMAAPAVAADTYIRCETDAGNILLVMQPEIAPHHAANFTHLARTGFYNGVYFHRVIPGFMIQCGDPNTKNADRADDGTGGPQWSDALPAAEWAIVEAALPLRAQGANATPEAKQKIEAADKLLAAKGFAWKGSMQAALKGEFSKTHKHLRGVLSMARTSDPNSAGSQFFLMVADYPSLDGQYSIFGHVVTGMDVADKIVASQRDGRDNPLQSIRIRKMTVIDGTAGLNAAEKAAAAKDKGAAAPKAPAAPKPAPAPKTGG